MRNYEANSLSNCVAVLPLTGYSPTRTRITPGPLIAVISTGFTAQQDEAVVGVDGSV